MITVRLRVTRPPLRRTAFTLVEVVLAMALMVALLSALYGAITLYAQLTTAGRTQVERAQLARAILRQIERDLHSVIYRESEAITAEPVDSTTSNTTGTGTGTGTTGTGTDTTSGTTTSEDAALIDPATAYTAAGGGIFGDASSLIMHINRPSRDLNYSLIGDGAGGRSSDLLSVSWFLAVANADGLQGAAGNLAAGGSALTTEGSGVQGLARLEGDRLAVTLADQQGKVEDLAAATEVVAEEINYVQFSYFDGVSWWTTWDSVSMGGLPQAVEIVIGFGPPPDQQQEQLPTSPVLEAAGAVDVQETYRLVVALPVAAPYVPMTEF